MIKEMIKKIVDGNDMTKEESAGVMNEIMSGEATDAQKAAFLTALSIKKETVDEITGAAECMRKHSVKLDHNLDVTEIVGTGGDGSGSFNISTTSAFVVAASGAKVAKHGNRAASSRSGAADVLEELGVNIDLDENESLRLLEETGFCFLFARNFHPAMKNVANVRSQIGIRTIFNILGPLTNPASAKRQLLGVYDKSLLEPMAKVLMNLGVEKGMCVWGSNGMDEISISAPTYVYEFENGKTKNYTIKPEDFGYNTCDEEEIKGGDPAENARITRDIIYGKDKGAKRDIVCLNAGAALYIAGKADSVSGGVALAQGLLESGKVADTLEKVIRISKGE